MCVGCCLTCLRRQRPCLTCGPQGRHTCIQRMHDHAQTTGVYFGT
jgi:hypothetical protein